VVGDGAPAWCEPSTSCGRAPTASGVPCTRLRNIPAKLPKQRALHDRVRAASWTALDEAINPADGEARLRELVGELAHDYPSAAACLADDLGALASHLGYPLRLRKSWRSSNLLERSLGEVRRRTKMMGASRARRAACRCRGGSWTWSSPVGAA
jgi:transposase-like protein